MRTRRIAALTLAFALVLALASPALAYSDTERHWAKDVIDEMTTRGLFNGTGGNLFEPEETMSRAMAVTVLWRFIGSPAYESIPAFTDVSMQSWYSAALRWATRCEIVTGYEDGTFRPNDPVSREELAMMLLRALMQLYPTQFTGAKTTPEFYAANWLEYANENYVDGWSGGYWASAALGWATMVGIFEGDGDGTLRPGDDLTRAEAAAVFSRTLATYGA